MRRTALAFLALSALSAPAGAAGLHPAFRAAQSPIVVVGKVTSIEPAPVDVEPFVGAKTRVPFKSAVLSVESVLSGPDGETHRKVGFPVQSKVPGLAPAVGDRGCFFLAPHATGQFLVIPANAPPLVADSRTYRDDLATVKKALSVLAKPDDALSATEPADRYFAAAVLLNRYGTPPPNAAKVEREPIPSGESRKVLSVLAEIDWTKPPPADLPGPLTLLGQLQPGPDDGWNPPPFSGPGDSAGYFQTQFRKWHATAGESYRVKKYVEKK